jgi:hypothetical protein
MYANFNRFELNLPIAVVLSCSQPGKDASEDVEAALRRYPSLLADIRDLDPFLVREELSEYGAWDEEELADDEENAERLVWLAACELKDELFRLLTENGLSDQDANWLMKN